MNNAIVAFGSEKVGHRSLRPQQNDRNDILIDRPDEIVERPGSPTDNVILMVHIQNRYLAVLCHDIDAFKKSTASCLNPSKAIPILSLSRGKSMEDRSEPSESRFSRPIFRSND